MPGNNEKTAAEQRDNSEKTAARSGEQWTAPQAELEIAIAENPVMRSIWERFFGHQEQNENNFAKGVAGIAPSRNIRSLARSLAVNCTWTRDYRILPQF
jgi:hypothetical protein